MKPACLNCGRPARWWRSIPSHRPLCSWCDVWLATRWLASRQRDRPVAVERPIGRRCPSCGSAMDPEKAWHWTSAGATDTENCARLLVEREVADER